MAVASLTGYLNLKNILQINTSAYDGGAGKVMSRLHQQYLSRGFNSCIVNKPISSPEHHIVTMDQILNWSYPFLRLHNSISSRIDRWIGLPNLYFSTKKLLSSNYFSKTDVFHIHNLHGRYFNYLMLDKFVEKKPIILTLHDMWAFTGHCSYSFDCQRWKTGCGDCPLFFPENRHKIHPSATWIDLTKYYWKLKQKAFNKLPIHIVSPSKWLFQLARESFLGKMHFFHHIPNGIDLNIFRPLDKMRIRAKYGIPQNLPVILFIAADLNLYRKGIQYLIQALQLLPEDMKLHLLIVGKQSVSLEKSLCYSSSHLGLVSNEQDLAEVYNASDVFAFPSLADNHPLVALESIACGTPVIAFDTGGVSEIVRNNETGYLATYADAYDFARGIQRLVNNPHLRSRLSIQCRRIALDEYSLDTQVDRYLTLYQEAIAERKSHFIYG